MKVDRSMKREIMEMVGNAYAVDPMAERKDVCDAVAREMEAGLDHGETVARLYAA